MALTQVTGPYPIFTDLDGSPLDDGYLFIGAANDDPETNPIQAYWDSALTIPATQPIRTNNGYAWRNGTPGLLYTAGEFSITIRNKRNEFVLYSPLGYGFDPAAVSASVVKNDFVGDGVTVNYTLSSAPSTILATNVFINGVYQEKDSYTLSGNVITFSVAPPLSSSIEILTNETGVINSTNASLVSYTLTAPGAVQQTVQTKLEQYVSVKDFGAAATASAAINETAFNAALASGAKFVVVPEDGGTYLVNDTITVPSGVTLMGQGMPTVKAANNAFPAGGAVFTLTSAVHSVIDGIKIDANLTNNGGSIYGVSGAQCSQVTVKNCHVTDATYGIWFTGGNTLKITDNVVDACTAYGIAVKLNDVTADCYNIVVTGNECKNITDGTTGPLTEGQGIIIYGATGPTLGDYKNIRKVIVNDNVCHGNGRQGISLVAVNDFVVDGNNCYDNLANTDLASGILISEACYNGTVTGNTCTNNYDAGILLDIADQTAGANYFLYGRVTVTGNSVYESVRAGIKVNSCPFSTISGNIIDGRRAGDNTRWGIFVSHGGFYNIVGNNVSHCSYNAIRIPGISGVAAPDQTNVIVADNFITNTVAPASDVIYGAIYVQYYDTVKIQNNVFLDNTQDISIRNTATNVTLLDNRFTSNIYTDASASIQRWDDEFRTSAAAASWFSAGEFAGSGMSAITLAAGFTVPHFGLQYLPLDTNGNNLTSSLTTAIYAGYFGQKIVILKVGAGTLTIKQGANTDNIGNADVVLSTGEMVEYTYTGTLWLQTTAKVATSL